MFSLKSVLAASAAATLVIGANANVVMKRNGEPAQPSCVSFTPFVYAGCFQDPSDPRALLYNSNLPTEAMTVEFVHISLHQNPYPVLLGTCSNIPVLFGYSKKKTNANYKFPSRKCVAFCKGNDYEYAGLEYYGECFCGSSVNGAQLSESSCTFPCTGNSSETCGGDDIISVYQDPTFPVVDDSTISDYQYAGCYSGK
jgi:hypothetical protein